MVKTKTITEPVQNYAKAIQWRLTNLTSLYEGKPEKTAALELEEDFNNWLIKFNETVKGFESGKT